MLAIFVALDLWFYRKDRLVTTVGESSAADRTSRVSGTVNLVLIAGIIAAILVSAAWKPGIAFDVYGTRLELQNLVRDAALLLIALALARAHAERAPRGQRLHLGADPRGGDPVRRHLRLHHSGAGDAAGRQATARSRWLLAAVTARDGSPHEVAYFWLTGMLSAFLDNAPTYLVFFELAGGDARELMGPLAATLAAISMGAVYMGALTYIGNAPNFMVYAIAVERGVKMPSFFGYMVWSCAVLLPVLALLTFVFIARPW